MMRNAPETLWINFLPIEEVRKLAMYTYCFVVSSMQI